MRNRRTRTGCPRLALPAPTPDGKHLGSFFKFTMPAMVWRRRRRRLSPVFLCAPCGSSFSASPQPSAGTRTTLFLKTPIREPRSSFTRLDSAGRAEGGRPYASTRSSESIPNIYKSLPKVFRKGGAWVAFFGKGTEACDGEPNDGVLRR